MVHPPARAQTATPLHVAGRGSPAVAPARRVSGETLQLGKDGNKMSNRFSANTDWAPASVTEEPRQDALDTEGLENFGLLSVEEIERLIAYCEAPALLWRDEPRTARAPEPFGMIA
jgi:hypothetical protein